MQATLTSEPASSVGLNFAPMEIQWGEGNKYQIEKAKQKYQQARREGRIITDLNDNPIVYFTPEILGFKIKGKALKEGEFSVRILNEHGDETIMFSANFPDQVQNAEKKFEQYLKKGWTAYAVSSDGKRRRRITMFNADLQEITFVEPGKEASFKERISEFVKSFGQITMLPVTRPG